MPTFEEAREYLNNNGSIELPYATNKNVIFTASADVCLRGPRTGQPIIRIRSGLQSKILIYENDWGNDYTSSGALIRHVNDSLIPYLENHQL